MGECPDEGEEKVGNEKTIEKTSFRGSGKGGQLTSSRPRNGFDITRNENDRRGVKGLSVTEKGPITSDRDLNVTAPQKTPRPGNKEDKRAMTLKSRLRAQIEPWDHEKPDSSKKKKQRYQGEGRTNGDCRGSALISQLSKHKHTIQSGKANLTCGEHGRYPETKGREEKNGTWDFAR